MNGLALCAGVGGLELGLRLALGGRYRAVCYVERDAFAASVLVARMEEAALDPAPIWDDLKTFDGRAWRGKVDLVSAGIPCQPHSVAGRRRGVGDSRDLWPSAARVIREVAPGLVFLENVGGAKRFFFAHVVRDLRAMGYVCHPPVFATAAHYGAPHDRERVFLLATDSDATVRLECGGSSGSGGTGPAEPRGLVSQLTDSNRDRRKKLGGSWVFNVERQTFRHDTDRCDLRCCICGTPWATESPVCRVDDGAAYRLDRLRALGNGVVPLVAAHAFRVLLNH